MGERDVRELKSCMWHNEAKNEKPSTLNILRELKKKKKKNKYLNLGQTEHTSGAVEFGLSCTSSFRREVFFGGLYSRL